MYHLPIKVVLIGPESTGKTTLAKQLAEHYQTVWVKEYAREYIEALERPYKKEDLLEIAKGQLKAETVALAEANKIVFCDTDLIVVQIWSEVKYGACEPWILEQIEERHYDLYLLCGTDIPWEYDEQREHPTLRAELFEKYIETLNYYQKEYVELSGNETVRLQKAIQVINQIL